MPIASLWEHTLTFFPQFLRALTEECPPGATVTVVGASDGKFVLPLAQAGYHVIAIEKDPLALYGGEVLLPVIGMAAAPGLVARLKEAGLYDQVRIELVDFLDTDPAAFQADAVWTSCSWHYSVNHRRPLGDFVGRMQHCVSSGGLFGAEFMMPVAERHHQIEHYTTPTVLTDYFGKEWESLLSLKTEPFTECAHVGQRYDHTHRMGLLLAKRSTNQMKGSLHPDEA
jgi:hypothetical protein